MPHIHLFVSLTLGLFVCAAVAADEPRLTPADVRRAADAAARQQADLKAYTRGEPSYDPVSKTWGINYRLRSFASPSAGQGILSVDVSDTTGLASVRFWLATPTPSPPTPSRFSKRFIIDMFLLALTVAMLIWFFVRKRLKHEVPSKA
jgi:hypothetical protein